jgi:exopolysaccharide biosynthesis polyprenyl glycosylphosphotransferase
LSGAVLAVEAEPFHITNQQSESAPVEVPTPSRGGGFRAPGHRRTPAGHRRLEDTSHLKLDAPAQVRLGLQRRASYNLRRHVNRAAIRFVALVVADLAAFGLMRELIRAVRDGAVLGAWLSEKVLLVLPPGYMNGWQFASALFVGLLVLGNYGPGDRRRDPWRLFLACSLATALPLWTMLWARGLEVVLIEYFLTVALVWAGVMSERLILDRIISKVRRPERDAVEAVFVGNAEACAGAAASPAFASSREYRGIGFIDVRDPPGVGALGTLRDFPLILAASGAEVVVVCGFFSDRQFHDVVDGALAGGCQVLAVPREMQVVGVHPTTVWRAGQPLVELTRPALKGRQLFLKRFLDLVGSAFWLTVLSPLIAFIYVAIKLESRGPAIFGHRRLGINGRVFNCLKFRSMHADAEARLQADAALHAEYVNNNYKLSEHRDPRLTRVGRLLRKTSLDELPQLINVFRGEMSLVGPRPIVPEELGQYGPGAAAFLSLKPGMTGAWGINGRSEVGYPNRADMELEYVRNWSLGRDLWILLMTAPAVLKRRGAH